MNIFKTDKTFLMIKWNGKLHHIPTEVTYSCEEDVDEPDFDYGSEAENEKIMKQFQSEELANLLLKVTVRALGEEADDYLGQCFVNTKNWEVDLLNIAAANDMVNEACMRLKVAILEKYTRLKEALE